MINTASCCCVNWTTSRQTPSQLSRIGGAVLGFPANFLGTYVAQPQNNYYHRHDSGGFTMQTRESPSKSGVVLPVFAVSGGCGVAAGCLLTCASIIILLQLLPNTHCGRMSLKLILFRGAIMNWRSGRWQVLVHVGNLYIKVHTLKTLQYCFLNRHAEELNTDWFFNWSDFCWFCSFSAIDLQQSSLLSVLHSSDPRTIYN